VTRSRSGRGARTDGELGVGARKREGMARDGRVSDGSVGRARAACGLCFVFGTGRLGAGAIPATDSCRVCITGSNRRRRLGDQGARMATAGCGRVAQLVRARP